MQQALGGSEAAFGELAGRYRDGLFRFLLLRCGSRADAEDALQDTLVNAWRYLGSYDTRWRFSTWLYRIGIRNAGRYRARPSASPEEPVDETADPLADCIDQSSRENLWITARRALSQEAYTVMWMHYAEDLPVADIALALDRTRTWTRVVLLRSRRRLSREFDNE